MLRGLLPIVRKVASLEAQVEKLSQADMREKMAAFKKAIAGESATLDDVLPEVFALVREASKRATRLRPFD
ncbi:MAG TPA: hypothetical protein VKF62_02435, partial [Planctomycetota bacterium]|nr:hypothetical protein [Planctomycetota bacterium]